MNDSTIESYSAVLEKRLMKIRVATRGSALALKQTDIAIEYLKEYLEDVSFEKVIINTHGDKDQKTALYNLNTNGVFMKEVVKALLDDEADIAVHSLKDVPSVIHEGMALLPFEIFEDDRDCLISKNGLRLSELREGAVIATSSIRRMAAIHHIRKDISFVNIRGNINTRLKKFMESDCDAMILAAAGLKRLGLEEYISEYLDEDIIIPACGQGVIGIEVKRADLELYEKIMNNHSVKHQEILIAREFLRRSGSSCHYPVGLKARIMGDKIHINAMLGDNIDNTVFINKTYEMCDIDTLVNMIIEDLRKEI